MDKLSSRQPKEMYWLALTEMCQRFAFWGIGNLLVLYLVQYQKFSDLHADQLFGTFTGIAFILPVLGGWLADRFNYHFPVMLGIVSTFVGCVLVAFCYKPLLYPGLLFVALGAAVFTPSIYALLGGLYHHQHNLRDSGFSIYYSMVNVGVFLATLILGFIGQSYSWRLAFSLAALSQLLGFAFFRKILKTYPFVNTQPIKTSEKTSKPPLSPQEKQRIGVICVLAFFSILFWMAYNQGGSSMNLFALQYTNRYIGRFQMPPSWLLSSESLYLFLLAFPLAKLYLYLAKKNLDPSPPLKCALSLFMIGLCFLVMVFGSSSIPTWATESLVSPWYLFIAYAFMALGEMLIAPIGLALITHLSPRRFTAMLVGIWYLCLGIALYLGGAIAPWMSKVKQLSHFFSVFVILCFAAAILLLTLVKKLNTMRHYS